MFSMVFVCISESIVREDKLRMSLHAPGKGKMHAFKYVCMWQSYKKHTKAIVCGNLVDPFQMSIYDSFVIAMKLTLIAKMGPKNEQQSW